jgi:Uma2 family endonuclease
VAHWSLKFDTTVKASLYASAGVRDYWVVNARTLATKVYRGPSRKGYGSVLDVKSSKVLVRLGVPSLTLKLADLAID